MAFALLGAWACFAAAARGDEPPDPLTVAKQLSTAGAADYKAERYEQALEKFLTAYRGYPAATLLLNISRTELKLSRCADAVHYAQLFRDATARQGGAPELPESWLATVQRSCVEAEVDSNPSGATIWIDGERQVSPEKTPWTGRLPVGKHKVLVWLPGYQKQGAFLQVTADAPANLALTLFPATTPEATPVAAAAPESGRSVQLAPTPAPAAHAPPAALKPAPNPLLRKAGYAALAVGGAALITAIALGAAVNGESASAGRITGPRTVPQANAIISSSAAEASGADALFVIGGLLAAGGVSLAVVF